MSKKKSTRRRRAGRERERRTASDGALSSTPPPPLPAPDPGSPPDHRPLLLTSTGQATADASTRLVLRGRGVDALGIFVRDMILNPLVRARLEAAATQRSDVELEGVRWAVKRAKGGLHLVNKLLGVRMTVRQKFVSVMMEAWALWEDGRNGGDPLASAYRCWRWLESYVRRSLDVGGAPSFNVIRLDLAADFTGWNDLAPAQIARFRTAATSRAPRTFDGEAKGDGLSLEFGRMPRCARVYLKSTELRQSQKGWFWDVWSLEPSSAAVVRVEFRWGTDDKAGNQITEALGSSDPVHVLSPSALSRLWLNATGVPGTLAGWLSLRQGNVMIGEPSAAVLDHRWEDVQRVRWDNWRSADGRACLVQEQRLRQPGKSLPGLLGGLRWFARERGLSNFSDALAVAIPALIEEEQREPGAFAARLRADELEHGASTPMGRGRFVEAMRAVHYESGQLAIDATPTDVADELWRDIAATAALLHVRGEPAPWSSAVLAVMREVEANRYLSDAKCVARRAAVYKLPLVLTGAPGADPYAVLPPAGRLD